MCVCDIVCWFPPNCRELQNTTRKMIKLCVPWSALLLVCVWEHLSTNLHFANGLYNAGWMESERERPGVMHICKWAVEGTNYQINYWLI